MGWFGKMVGGTLGFALAGPLGAIAGAVFGHAFDKDDSPQQYRYLSSGETAQLTFFVAAFSMLAKLVRTDGRIEKEEIDAIEKFMAEDLNLNPESRQYARNIFQTALRSGESFDDFAVQFYNQFRYQPQFLELMIDIMLRVAVSDAALSVNEEKIIQSAAHIFNFSDETDPVSLKNDFIIEHTFTIPGYYDVKLKVIDINILFA